MTNKVGEISMSSITNTYWNRKRIEKKITLQALSAEIGCTVALLSKYFTGAVIPPTSMAYRICEFFGVDPTEGATEFNNAHEAWIAKHPGKRKQRSVVHSRRFYPPTEVAPKDIAVSTQVSVAEPDNVSEINDAPCTADTDTPTVVRGRKGDLFALIYSTLDYDEFMALALNPDLTVDMFLKAVYTKVDCKTFLKMLDIIKG